MMIMRILMIGNKKAGTIQQFVWCLFACWYVVVYLSWRNECDMILLSVEFVIHMEEHFGREQSG